jgi:hypothetical protein
VCSGILYPTNLTSSNGQLEVIAMHVLINSCKINIVKEQHACLLFYLMSMSRKDL